MVADCFDAVVLSPQRLHGTRSDRWRWWPNDQFGEPAQVLCDSRERELILCPAWAPKPKAAKLQDALEMGEQHLNTLSFTT